MTATVPLHGGVETSSGRSDHRKLLLGLAALRGALGILAIPLAPMLYRDHVAALVLLRPTKEVFLFAGFQVSESNTTIPVVVVSALALLVGGVWVFFGLGRAFADDLADDDLPGIAGRLLPRRRVKRLQDVLEDRGMPVVFLGRLAAFPSSLVAAAAGASGMSFRRFAVADGAGALVSLAALVGAGLALQEAYESAGIWVTAVGVVVLAVLVVAFGRWLTREPAAAPRRGGHEGAS